MSHFDDEPRPSTYQDPVPCEIYGVAAMLTYHEQNEVWCEVLSWPQSREFSVCCDLVERVIVKINGDGSFLGYPHRLEEVVKRKHELFSILTQKVLDLLIKMKIGGY